MLKLLVVEDHALVRESMVRLLAQLEESVYVLEAADFEQALTVLDDAEEVDLVLLDLAMPGIDGFAGLDILRRRYPAMPVAVVSAHDDLPTINRVIHLGASVFIPKALSGEAVLAAIRDVLAGNIFLPKTRSGAHIDNIVPIPPVKKGVSPREIGLTDRQGQVLCMIVRGLSNRDIADKLCLSEGTVKVHLTAIYKVLEVNSRTQALLAVERYGIDFESVF